MSVHKSAIIQRTIQPWLYCARCPYDNDEEERELKLCTYFLEECPFGHRGSEPMFHRLLPIPKHVCLKQLQGKCTNKTKKVVYDFSLGYNVLRCCGGGLHPTDLLQLVAPNYFKQINAIITSAEPCSICLEMTCPQHGDSYGVLRNCVHVFCFKCILQAFKGDPLMRCPVCRVPSEVVIEFKGIGVPAFYKKGKLKCGLKLIANIHLFAFFSIMVETQQ